MIIIFFVVVTILIILLIGKMGSIDQTIKTKLLSYHALKEENTRVSKNELYLRVLNMDPYFDNLEEEKKSIAKSKNFREVVFSICSERFINNKFRNIDERVKLIREISVKIDKMIPEDY